MPQKRTGPILSFDLPDDEAACRFADEIARRIGREIVVTDEDGNEVYTAKPPRRNEIIVRKKT
jgi:hypothetical protein